MPWYLDLVAVGLMAVAGIGYMQVYYRWLMKSTPMTKDGYKVQFSRLMLLEAEWKLEKKGEEENLNLMALQVGGYKFDSSMVLKLLIYYGIASLAEYWLGGFLNALALTSGYAIATLGMAHYHMRKNYQMALVHISQLPIAAPAEFRQYGLYAWNPFDLKSALEKLESLNIRKNYLTSKVQNIQRHSKIHRFGRTSPGEETEIGSMVEETDSIARHIEALTTCIKEELLTNDDFLIAEAGNKPKQLEKNVEGAPVSPEPEESGSPHHIEVMKGIASNPNLPAEVAERAEKLVKKHDAQEAERQRQKEIADALISIETVEKYYEADEEKGMTT